MSDFRVADVAAGGQGAPLTSTYDYTVLRPKSGEGWRAFQNIGTDLNSPAHNLKEVFQT